MNFYLRLEYLKIILETGVFRILLETGAFRYSTQDWTIWIFSMRFKNVNSIHGINIEIQVLKIRSYVILHPQKNSIQILNPYFK